MSDNYISAVIEDGPLIHNRIRIRYGDSQMDGKWHVVEVEIAGRLLPLEDALQFLNYPKAEYGL